MTGERFEEFDHPRIIAAFFASQSPADHRWHSQVAGYDRIGITERNGANIARRPRPDAS